MCLEELLMHLNSHELKSMVDTSNPYFEIATWLTLKNTKHLPAILLLEYTDRSGKFWQIIDIATIRFKEGVVLLSGSVDLGARRVNEINIYLCHPSSSLQCEIEELRINNQMLAGEVLETCNVA